MVDARAPRLRPAVARSRWWPFIALLNRRQMAVVAASGRWTISSLTGVPLEMDARCASTSQGDAAAEKPEGASCAQATSSLTPITRRISPVPLNLTFKRV